ncbi:hypothetical protein B0H14DRAFT_3426139 [Mycena olivaceomarginata]|nr:hypothetical protein B0H14DRAFT_3426139 [Mycena olivaceomarginata]
MADSLVEQRRVPQVLQTRCPWSSEWPNILSSLFARSVHGEFDSFTRRVSDGLYKRPIRFPARFRRGASPAARTDTAHDIQQLLLPWNNGAQRKTSPPAGRIRHSTSARPHLIFSSRTPYNVKKIKKWQKRFVALNTTYNRLNVVPSFKLQPCLLRGPLLHLSRLTGTTDSVLLLRKQGVRCPDEADIITRFFGSSAPSVSSHRRYGLAQECASVRQEYRKIFQQPETDLTLTPIDSATNAGGKTSGASIVEM